MEKININTLTIDADGDGYIKYAMPVAPGSRYTVTYTNPYINNFDVLEILPSVRVMMEL